MNEYDVILVIFSLVAFVVSICKITARFTRAISRLELTVEQLGSALEELKHTIVSIRKDTGKVHAEIFTRLEKIDRRIIRLETERGIVCEKGAQE